MAATKKQPPGAAAVTKIDELVAGLDDWRGELLAKIRTLVLDAVDESWKWMGSPVWEQNGIVAVGKAHKQKVKLTFPDFTQLPDPDGVATTASVVRRGARSTCTRATRLTPLPSKSLLVRQAAVYNANSS